MLQSGEVFGCVEVAKGVEAERGCRSIVNGLSLLLSVKPAHRAAALLHKIAQRAKCTVVPEGV